MKKFNKFVAVLIVISLLSSFAVFASAEYPTGDFQMRYTDTTGKQITSAKTGDLIDVYISINTAGRYLSAFQADIMYDFAKVTQIRQNGTSIPKSINANNCRELLGDMAETTAYITDENDPWVQYDIENDEWGGYYLIGKGTFTATPHTDTGSLYPASWDDAMKAQYKCCRFSYITVYTIPVIGVYTDNEYMDFVRFRFYANEDIETLDASVIGWSEGASVAMNTEPDNIGLSVYMSGYEKMPVTTSYAEVAVVESPVYWVKNQIQWNNKEEESVNIGIVAGFDVDDIPISFTDGVSTNVKEVGVKYYINNVFDRNLTTTRVYRAKGGEAYYFRAVLGGISTTTTDTYKVVPYIVYDDGTGAVIHEGTEVEIKPADVARYVTVLPQ